MLLIALAFGELTALAVRLAVGGHSVLDLAAIHGLAVTASGGLVYLARRAGRDTTYPVIGFISGVPLGPFGMLGAALLMLADRRSPHPSPLITDWYDRIALSTNVPADVRLCDDVEVGRTLDLTAGAPISFPDAMMIGPLAERQAILGHIARHFHPHYLATLKIALASEEPLIRVQAAAVAAHIAPSVRDCVRGCARLAAARPADPLAALGLLGDVEALIAGGLLDQTDRLDAQRLARDLGDRVLAGLARGPLGPPYATDVALAAALEAHLEELLIARKCFGALRAHRKARRLRARHPGARLKRLTRVGRSAGIAS